MDKYKKQIKTAQFISISTQSCESITAKKVEELFSNGSRIALLAESESLRDSIDNTLWSYKKLSFIPHATELDDNKEDQIVYISTNEALNLLNIIKNFK